MRKELRRAVLLFSDAGRKGGKARAEKLTPEERRKIARRASLARWGKRAQERKEVTLR